MSAVLIRIREVRHGMPVAPAVALVDGSHITNRRNETHPCLLCHRVAVVALVMHPERVDQAPAGRPPDAYPRWLDLCADHDQAVRHALDAGGTR